MSVAATRWVAGLAAAEGLALLIRPVQVGVTLGLGEPPPRGLVRLLGARQVLQHAALAVAPSRLGARLAAGTEVLHALSMVGAAALWPRHARAALTSAAGASALALAVLAAAPAQAPPDELWADPTR